jgi:hypothetical protein
MSTLITILEKIGKSFGNLRWYSQLDRVRRTQWPARRAQWPSCYACSDSTDPSTAQRRHRHFCLDLGPADESAAIETGHFSVLGERQREALAPRAFQPTRIAR